MEPVVATTDAAGPIFDCKPNHYVATPHPNTDYLPFLCSRKLSCCCQQGLFEYWSGLFEDLHSLFGDLLGLIKHQQGLFVDLPGMFEQRHCLFEDWSSLFQDRQGLFEQSHSPLEVPTAPGEWAAAGGRRPCWAVHAGSLGCPRLRHRVGCLPAGLPRGILVPPLSGSRAGGSRVLSCRLLRRIKEDYEEAAAPVSIGVGWARTQEADRAGRAIMDSHGRGAGYALHQGPALTHTRGGGVHWFIQHIHPLQHALPALARQLTSIILSR
jgi:hypothetical protein